MGYCREWYSKWMEFISLFSTPDYGNRHTLVERLPLELSQETTEVLQTKLLNLNKYNHK